MSRRIGIGTSAVAAGRLFGIPASNIRKWVYRNKIHTYRDGSIDIGCLGVFMLREEHTPEQFAELHAQHCLATQRGNPDDLRRQRRAAAIQAAGGRGPAREWRDQRDRSAAAECHRG